MVPWVDIVACVIDSWNFILNIDFTFKKFLKHPLKLIYLITWPLDVPVDYKSEHVGKETRDEGQVQHHNHNILGLGHPPPLDVPSALPLFPIYQCHHEHTPYTIGTQNLLMRWPFRSLNIFFRRQIDCCSRRFAVFFLSAGLHMDIVSPPP